jgi:hypothetical protein
MNTSALCWFVTAVMGIVLLAALEKLMALALTFRLTANGMTAYNAVWNEHFSFTCKP